jgi:hypothetical protein
MPRLSIYKPEKGADFKFFDKIIQEQFQIGGTDIMIHKYLGPVDPAEGESSPSLPVNSNNIPELGIQDLIFMENRDRKYAPDVYCMRGIYTMQDLDFNLSQFGLFLTSDNIMINFHLKSSVESLGRKIMSGDVFELPHLKDEYALDNSLVALKRFYVVTDVSRPTGGFSPTWYPHLLRAKCAPLVDSQEFKEILDGLTGDGDQTIRDLISTYNQSLEINKSIIEQAQADAPLSGYNTNGFFIIPGDEHGLVDIADASDTTDTVDSDQSVLDASVILRSPKRDYYVGYLTGDGIPLNGAPYTFGNSFPTGSVDGQYHLRTDYFPNTLFRFDGKRWVKFEDKVRMTLNNFGQDDVSTTGTFPGSDVRLTQRGTFINNVNTATIGGEVIQERQALSKALRPKADN